MNGNTINDTINCNFTDPTGRPSLFSLLCAALGALWFVGFSVLLSLCGGCRAFYENAGSRTVVGSVTAPLDVSDSSDNVAAKLLYSMDGASVYTAKDSLVKIHYQNNYTNSYIGCVDTRGVQDLTVEIEPLATGGDDTAPATAAETNSAETATNATATATTP